MRHLGVGNITSLQCQYCIICYFLHLYSTLWFPFVVVQSLSRVWLFVTPWTAARQAPLSSSVSESLLKFMSTGSLMLFSHLILSVVPFSSCPHSFPASGSFPVSHLCIRRPKCWSFSFSISPSNEYSGLIFFRIDWFDCLAVQGTLVSSPAPQFKSINSWVLNLVNDPTHIHTRPLEKP